MVTSRLYYIKARIPGRGSKGINAGVEEFSCFNIHPLGVIPDYLFLHLETFIF